MTGAISKGMVNRRALRPSKIASMVMTMHVACMQTVLPMQKKLVQGID